jgi:hypothetical protein
VDTPSAFNVDGLGVSTEMLSASKMMVVSVLHDVGTAILQAFSVSSEPAEMDEGVV